MQPFAAEESVKGWANVYSAGRPGGVAPVRYGLSREALVQQRRQSNTSLVPRGRALFWEGEHRAQKIEIIEDVVRAVRLLENGNRQILAFYLPGDVVMPTQSSCQRVTAEAVTNCRCSSRRLLASASRANPAALTRCLRRRCRLSSP